MQSMRFGPACLPEPASVDRSLGPVYKLAFAVLVAPFVHARTEINRFFLRDRAIA
jgi:hypothetical protein